MVYKNDDMRVLTEDREMMVNRWIKYFKELLNEAFPREAVETIE